MKITIAGGHGKIAMLLHPMLANNGHSVKGLIRKPEQADDLCKAGAEPVLCDIEKEDDISDAVGDADAVVFSAGAGPGSGAERKWTVDRDGAVKLIEAARSNGINRYIMISAMGLDKPRGSDVFRIYQKAKAEADEILRKSGLDYTIIKPGRLTDEPGTGMVSIAEELPRGEISREDVAAVIARTLELPKKGGLTFDLISGKTPIDEALNQIL
jgi:uncharacterized protein YbjT (DUF2867 family)